MSRSCYSCGSTTTYMVAKYEGWLVNRDVITGKEIGVICGRCYCELDFRKRKKYGSREKYADAKKLTALGKNNPFYHKIHTPESKLRISISKRGKSNGRKDSEYQDTQSWGVVIPARRVACQSLVGELGYW